MLCRRGYSAAPDAAASSGRWRPLVREALMAHLHENPGDASHVVDERAPRWGAVLAFMLVYVVSYIDRQVLTIVVDPVKLSLGINDTQIGLLQGFLFTTVLIVAAVPMAYLVDRFSRVNILVGCMAVWSGATVLSGFADNFGELAAGRIGLALAEAVVPMAAMSVIGDLFPRHRVGRAAAVFMNGSYFGNGAAMLLSGWLIAIMKPFNGHVVPLLGRFETWRGLFIAVGLLGVIVAIGLRIYLREPVRRELRSDTDADQGDQTFWRFFWTRRRFILSYCAFAGFISLIGYSVYAWTATLLIRVHHMAAQTVGLIMGPMFLVTSIPGTALTAWLGSRCRPQEALQHLIKVMICLTALLTPILIALPLVPKTAAIVLVGLTLVVFAANHAAILVPV